VHVRRITAFSRYLVFILLPGIFLVSQSAFAVERQNLFDWYYSAVFGTGAYSIAGRDVFVINIPYERTLREASEDKYKLVLTAPLTLGFYDYGFDSITDLDIPTDVATATLLPGIYAIVPMSEDWTLKPFANLGYGKEFAGGEDAIIYSAGVRSLYRIRDDAWHIALGNALYYAGNTRAGQTDLGFAAFEAAIDVSHETGYVVEGQKLYLGVYAALYTFSNLEFIESEDTTFEVRDQYEIGVSMSTHKPVKVLGIEMDRIGIGYLTSGDLKAVRLAFSFPY
jgi:hypothetical protein